MKNISKSMWRTFFFTFIMIYSSLLIFAQQTNLDSLIARLELPLPASEKVDLLNRIAIDLRRNNPEQGLIYSQQALDIATKNNYSKGIRDGYNSSASVLFSMGDYFQALDLFKKSLVLSQEFNEPKKIAHSYYGIGVIYRRLGKYPESLEYELKALKINEELKDTLEVATSLMNIAIIHTNMGNYEKALETNTEAKVLQEQINDIYGIASSNIGLGNIYFYQNRLDEALLAYEEAMKIGIELNDLRLISLCNDNIAGIYASNENYSEALKNYQASLEIDKTISNKSGMARSYTWIGAIYFKLNDYKKSAENLQQSLNLATELNDLEQLEHIHSVWTSLDSAQGNYDAALINFRLAVGYRDSLVNQANTEKIVQQQMQFDFDKKQAVAQIQQEKEQSLLKEEVKQQKLLRNLFVIGFVVILIFLIVVARQRKKIKIGKQRSDELLLNILPADVAEELKNTGESEARDYDDVTVLFTDFQGFTSTAEKLTAKELVEELNHCFKAFDEIMAKYGLEKIKTIGDAYMAAGGLQIPKKSEPKDVIKAALEMQEIMQLRKEEQSKIEKPTFEMRVGIHTGPVVAGIVGIKKFQYDIWGDTVNTASRMESSGEVGKVNISQATYGLLKDDSDFAFESRGKIEAKGKGEMEMYFVKSI